MAKVPEIFGSMVFNDQKMQERLPKSTYKALKRQSRTVNRLTSALQMLLRLP